MLFLISTIILSTAIFITFKLFERYKVNKFQAIVVNYLVASGLGFLLSPNFAFNEIPGKEWFGYAIICGIVLNITFYIFAISTQKAGVAITAVSSKMSVVIPIIFGILIYKESVGAIKIIGIIAALLSFYLTFRKAKNVQKPDLRYFVLPILLFIGNGINDTLLKHSERNFVKGDTTVFLSTAFLFSFIAGLLIFAGSSIIKNRNIQIKNILAGVTLGLINWFSTYFFLKGMGIYQSTFYFPVINVSIVMLSAMTGYFIFKEKLSMINWAGVIIAAVSIILITFAITN
jgi:drug/metabolite transporter (DMT)-like permease